jgi:prepilin-type processing-associated H-X9-DG protein
MGVAVHFYANDADGHLPKGPMWGNNYGRWRRPIAPYLGVQIKGNNDPADEDVFGGGMGSVLYCPSSWNETVFDREKGYFWYDGHPNKGPWSPVVSPYGANVHMVLADGARFSGSGEGDPIGFPSDGEHVTKLVRVGRASEKVCYGDLSANWYVAAWAYPRSSYKFTVMGAYQEMGYQQNGLGNGIGEQVPDPPAPNARHGGGQNGNFTFYDGHVESLAPEIIRPFGYSARLEARDKYWWLYTR